MSGSDVSGMQGCGFDIYPAWELIYPLWCRYIHYACIGYRADAGHSERDPSGVPGADIARMLFPPASGI